jgi:hypothetical protein
MHDRRDIRLCAEKRPMFLSVFTFQHLSRERNHSKSYILGCPACLYVGSEPKWLASSPRPSLIRVVWVAIFGNSDQLSPVYAGHRAGTGHTKQIGNAKPMPRSKFDNLLNDLRLSLWSFALRYGLLDAPP